MEVQKDTLTRVLVFLWPGVFLQECLCCLRLFVRAGPFGGPFGVCCLCAGALLVCPPAASRSNMRLARSGSLACRCLSKATSKWPRAEGRGPFTKLQAAGQALDSDSVKPQSLSQPMAQLPKEAAASALRVSGSESPVMRSGALLLALAFAGGGEARRPGGRGP